MSLSADHLIAKWYNPPQTDSVVEHHFALHDAIWVLYAGRHLDPAYIEATEILCHQQIKISELAAIEYRKLLHGQGLPVHLGYQSLAIFEGNRGNHTEAIRLYAEAMQHGWRGEWAHWISREHFSTAQDHQNADDFAEATKLAEMALFCGWEGAWLTLLTDCCAKLARRREQARDLVGAVELADMALALGLSGKWVERLTRYRRQLATSSIQMEIR